MIRWSGLGRYATGVLVLDEIKEKAADPLDLFDK